MPPTKYIDQLDPKTRKSKKANFTGANKNKSIRVCNLNPLYGSNDVMDDVYRKYQRIQTTYTSFIYVFIRSCKIYFFELTKSSEVVDRYIFWAARPSYLQYKTLTLNSCLFNNIRNKRSTYLYVIL